MAAANEVATYTPGVHYQVAALQASMAVQINGDTIHHALHIPKGGFFAGDGNAATAGQEKLAQFLQLQRWLIIDEISMISARFLADIDLRHEAP